MELKKPRSGFFINDDHIDESTRDELPYDPRKLQSGIDELSRKKGKKFIVDETKNVATFDESIAVGKDQCVSSTQATFDRQSIMSGTMSLVPLGPAKEPVSYRQQRALEICAFAFLYSRLYNPICWTSFTVDTVLTRGSERFADWCNQNYRGDVFSIGSIPSIYNLDKYRIEIDLKPFAETGVFTHELSFACSALIKCVRTMFNENKVKGLLIEIYNYALVLWIYDGLYYMFDPFERDSTGSAIPMNLTSTKDKPLIVGKACLIMNNKLEFINEKLYDNLLATVAVPADFNCHAIEVIRMDHMEQNKYVRQAVVADEEKVDNNQTSPDDGLKLKNRAIVGKMDKVMPIPNADLSDLSLRRNTGRKKRRPISRKENPPILSIMSGYDNSQQLVDVVDETELIDPMLGEMCQTFLDPVVEKVVQECWDKCLQKGEIF